MIQQETMLKVADNSGARKILCITPLGGGVGKYAAVGDVISASVKEAEPESKIPKGKVIRAVVVRTKKEIRRKGSERMTRLLFFEGKTKEKQARF